MLSSYLKANLVVSTTQQCWTTRRQYHVTDINSIMHLVTLVHVRHIRKNCKPIFPAHPPKKYHTRIANQLNRKCTMSNGTVPITGTFFKDKMHFT